MAAKRMPIAVSSEMRRPRLRTAIPAAVTRPTARAPRSTLWPAANAITMPGKTACVSASPMNARPRRTT